MMKIPILFFLTCISGNIHAKCLEFKFGMPNTTKNVSMLDLLLNRNKYHKTFVQFKAVLDSTSPDKIRLYYRQEAYKYNLLSESLILEFEEKSTSEMKLKLLSFDGNFVEVIGMFEASKEDDYGKVNDIYLICDAIIRKNKRGQLK